ncbi:ABC transporter ATP-binding protein [Gordonia terrae]|uniref:ABC transporter ATP-binding protein n=2 Tax=Gordonia terrae TaxID=2055 RepID=A0AAD0K9V4_9ACTN|nr:MULTISPECIES: ABC transporter ATP-binding protein [Gordonia]VTR11939.1 ABC-type nitrate/sulfonate/bicarbonate transport system, ATPase component [Clostridioides difficile]ANY24756.1 sulfonate ABC transporter ATP-binding protein [Gordonia terrae]AWO85501.1 ABC transporter ATP-binding protein [Gordonia terrae]VTS60111.1 Aliphatic sulfonates import ATP-binding protein SsuB [Gordonia terrae]GAB44305.1 putative ABC transporter ATP-binding protein [Gordonia terrae NBRC 100016]
MTENRIDGVRVTGAAREFDGRRVLDRVDLTIERGEFVALLGASGSGKSTLLRGIGGLDRGFTGTIEAPSAKAIVFQEHRLMPWMSVWRNVALGLRGGDTEARALRALDEVGLAAKSDAWPSTLSGGEAQRTALARALVREPDLLLLDEPFGALDALTRINAQRLVARLWEAHRPATLLVTHDVEEALLLADRALILRAGRIAQDIIVDLPRPRRITDPEFVALRSQLLAGLGVGGSDAESSVPTTTSTATPTPREFTNV